MSIVLSEKDVHINQNYFEIIASKNRVYIPMQLIDHLHFHQSHNKSIDDSTYQIVLYNAAHTILYTMVTNSQAIANKAYLALTEILKEKDR